MLTLYEVANLSPGRGIVFKKTTTRRSAIYHRSLFDRIAPAALLHLLSAPIGRYTARTSVGNSSRHLLAVYLRQTNRENRLHGRQLTHDPRAKAPSGSTIRQRPQRYIHLCCLAVLTEDGWLRSRRSSATVPSNR